MWKVECLVLWPDIPPFGRITSDVIIGLSVTNFTTVGHIAILVYFIGVKN